jgi:hypothetical protein
LQQIAVPPYEGGLAEQSALWVVNHAQKEPSLHIVNPASMQACSYVLLPGTLIPSWQYALKHPSFPSFLAQIVPEAHFRLLSHAVPSALHFL